MCTSTYMHTCTYTNNYKHTSIFTQSLAIEKQIGIKFKSEDQ